ncbi:MAG: hypothetical protein AAF675_00540 [Pseudomonadota bacterium]
MQVRQTLLAVGAVAVLATWIVAAVSAPPARAAEQGPPITALSRERAGGSAQDAGLGTPWPSARLATTPVPGGDAETSPDPHAPRGYTELRRGAPWVGPDPFGGYQPRGLPHNWLSPRR